MKSRRAVPLLLVSLAAQAWPASEWSLARNNHFEIYSQSGEENARATLAWFEQLRGFFLRQDVIRVRDLPPLRVIVFSSRIEYEPYRLHSASDAHYVGGDGRDYILMAASGPGDIAVAAHEYSHFVLHASGYHLPLWLGEGLAEVFATAREADRAWDLGGDRPERSRVLRRREWMPIPDLLAVASESPQQQNRESGAIFYAQSWALADLLVFSPAYAPRFPQLMATLSAGAAGLDAINTVYAKSAAEVASDLRAWVYQTGRLPRRLPESPPSTQPASEVSDVSPRAANAVLADALLSAGDLDRSEAMYREIARQSPPTADVWAALGTIALRRGNKDAARDQWKRAIELGVSDPAVCYRYAVLASDLGLPADDIRPALERAVAARPGFDDARYMLALLEKNAGRFDAAVTHLRAMHDVGQSRAYGYWSAMAYALTELDRRDEAVAAAKQAADLAATPDQRAYAHTLDFMARTDPAVRFERDANGRAHLVTTRIPHATTNWNPFIEPGDDLHRVRGTLREVDCGGEHTRIRVATPDGLLMLAILDASRVEMRNAPPEFVCGPQADAPPVTVEFAASKSASADGVLRGMEFEQTR